MSATIKRENSSAHQVGKQQSQQLVQTLLTVSFGCIAFLRELFPEESFVDQRFVPAKFEPNYDPQDPESKKDSLRVKTLVKGKHHQVDLFLDWIGKGAADAISKGYLEALTLGIFLDEARPQEWSEAYVFNFSYKDGVVHFSVTTDQENDCNYKTGVNTLLNSRRALQQLMKRFIIVTQGLDPLPDEKFLTVRMMFNESCPKEYQPALFKDASNEKVSKIKVMMSDFVNFSAGRLDTGHHQVYLDVLSTPDIKNDDNDNMTEIDPFQLNPAPPLKVSHTYTSQTTANLRNFLNQSQSNIAPTQPLQNITCECKSTKQISNSFLLRCANCGGFVHSYCYNISKPSKLVTCFKCRSKTTNFKLHKNLAFLLNLKKLYKIIKESDFVVSSISDFHTYLNIDDIQLTVKVINFYLNCHVFTIDSNLKKLVKPTSSGELYSKGSQFIHVDVSGIHWNNEELQLKKYPVIMLPRTGTSLVSKSEREILRAFRERLFDKTQSKFLETDVSVIL